MCLDNCLYLKTSLAVFIFSPAKCCLFLIDLWWEKASIASLQIDQFAQIGAGEQEELRMERGTDASLQEDPRGAGSLGGLGRDESYFHSPWLSVCSQSCCGSVVIAV